MTFSFGAGNDDGFDALSQRVAESNGKSRFVEIVEHLEMQLVFVRDSLFTGILFDWTGSSQGGGGE
jgi:hypothetical protein